MPFSSRLLSLSAALCLLPGGAWSVPDVPLPEKTNRYDPGTSFPLLPPVDGLPPPEEKGRHVASDEDVILPPPAAPPEDLPDFLPLSAPSDGEAMPDLPYAPGLVQPKFNRNSVPSIASLQVNPETSPGDGFLPLPVPDLRADSSRGYWFPSPREARQVSIKEKKPMLLFFAQKFDARDEQGNTACPSIALNDDLFVPQNFNTFAGAKLILTSLQYPTKGLKSSNLINAKEDPKLAALQHFQTYFNVTGFPTVILIDDNGRELERFTGAPRRIKDSNDQLFSSAHTLLDRLREAVRRDDERKRLKNERMERFAAQGYRTWYNREGYSILAKFVDYTPDRVVLMDEKNALRYIPSQFLRLYDAEWARRRKAGLLNNEIAEPRTTATNP